MPADSVSNTNNVPVGDQMGTTNVIRYLRTFFLFCSTTAFAASSLQAEKPKLNFNYYTRQQAMKSISLAKSLVGLHLMLS